MIVKLVVFLILIFILTELYNYQNRTREHFYDKKANYDYYFDGDVFLKRRSGTLTNIGIGTKPNQNYYLNVNGKMTIDGKLNIGGAVLDYDLVSKLNKLPLYTKDKYCLYESENKETPQCVTRDELGMITGHRKIVFENLYGEKLTDLKLRHHGRHHGSEPGNNRGNNKWHEGIGYKDVRFERYQEPYWTREWHHTLQNKESDKIDETNQFQLLPQTDYEIIMDTDIVSLPEEENNNNSESVNIQGNFFMYNPLNDFFVRISGIENDKCNIVPEKSQSLSSYMKGTNQEFSEAVERTIGEKDQTYHAVLEKRGCKYCIRVYDKSLSDALGVPVWKFFNSIKSGIVKGDEEGRFTLFPYSTSFFTLRNFDQTVPVKKGVIIVDSSGRYMKVKRKFSDADLIGALVGIIIGVILVSACAAVTFGACAVAFAGGAKGGATSGVAASAAGKAAAAGAAAKASATTLGGATSVSGKALAGLAAAGKATGYGAGAAVAGTGAGALGAVTGTLGGIGGFLGAVGAGIGIATTKVVATTVVVTGAAAGGLSTPLFAADVKFEKHFNQNDCTFTILNHISEEKKEEEEDAGKNRQEYKCFFDE